MAGATETTRPYSVTIGGQKLNVTPSLDCRRQGPGWTPIEECTCCIIKEGFSPKGPLVSGSFVQRCVQKRFCHRNSLNQLFSPLLLRNNPDNYKALSRHLTGQALGVAKKPAATQPTEAQKQRANATLRKFLQRRRAFKKVAAPKSLDQIAKDANLVADSLTPSIVYRWLRGTDLVNRRILTTPGCVKVEETKGGSFTEKIFYVFYHRNCDLSTPKKLLFVVKGLKPKSAETELKNLQLLQGSPQLRTLSSLRDPNYPQITFSEDFYRFKTKAGEPRYLLLIHAARGQALQQIFKTGSPELQVQAFTAFGRTLGNFNKYFLAGENCILKGGLSIKACRTINHGDLHPNNVFFDGKYIYFIDTETLARSLRDLTPLFIDILYFYNLPIYKWKVDRVRFTELYVHTLNAYLNVLTPSQTVQQKMRAFLQKYSSSAKVAQHFTRKMVRLIRGG